MQAMCEVKIYVITVLGHLTVVSVAALCCFH